MKCYTQALLSSTLHAE